MNKSISVMNKSITKISIAIMLFIAIFLFFSNLLVNGYTMLYVQEIRYIFGISIIPFFLFCIFLYYKNWISLFLKKYHKALNIFFYLSITLICIYLCSNCLPPKYDSVICLSFAEQFPNLFTAELNDLFYIMQYPFNISMILLDRIAITISSTHYLFILYTLNITCLLLTYFFLEKIFVEFFKDKFDCCIFKLISLFWLPVFFMTTFIYGWLYGICSVTISIFSLLKFLNNNKVSYLFIYIFLLFLGIFMKLNYAIYGVAIILGLVFIIPKNKSSILCLVLTVICLISSLKAPTVINHLLFNTPENSNSPITLHLVMANYRDDNLYIPGWVDGSHEAAYYKATREGFLDASTRANSYAMDKLSEQLNNAFHQPTEAAKFYMEKLLSGWASKDFGIFETFEYTSRNLTKEYSFIVDLIYTVIQLATLIIFYGFLKYSILCFKHRKLDLIGWIFGISFIGFFIYYLISEIQSKYVIFAIFFIIPLSVMGLNDSIKLNNINSNTKVITLFVTASLVLLSNFNRRYVPINNNHTLKELVPYDIATPYSETFVITKNTTIDAINIMLSGSGKDDTLEISIYNEKGEAVVFNKFYNLTVDAYWWNTLDLNDTVLTPGVYSISIRSLTNNLKVLVNYDLKCYFELLKTNFAFTTIKDLRYIKPNNLFK